MLKYPQDVLDYDMIYMNEEPVSTNENAGKTLDDLAWISS